MNSFNAYLISGDASQVRSDFAVLSDEDLDPGDIVVRVAYASVNYKDALAATGKGRIIKRFPCVGGIDAVGIVESSGDARFGQGDAVIVHSHGFGVSHHGGYARRARVPADWVNKVPTSLSLLEAITIGVAGYTAALAIDLMELNGLTPGMGLVLVNGATGGVGSIGIDLLAQRGHHVVAATSKEDQVDYLRLLGASEVISSHSLPPATKPLEKARWQGAIDSLGGEPLAALTRTVQKDGVIASIGNAAGIEFSTTVMPFILRGVRLIGVNSDNGPELRKRIWDRLGGDLRPRHLASIANVEPFAALPAVMQAVTKGHIRGRTVIEVDPSVR
ncbi:MAG: acrylyl-CoA reductase family protein [Caldimonas sp.]